MFINQQSKGMVPWSTNRNDDQLDKTRGIVPWWIFSHNKFMKAKTTIIVLSKDAIEILCEALQRYKYMLRRCPNHDFDDLTQIHIFKNVLQQ